MIVLYGCITNGSVYVTHQTGSTSPTGCTLKMSCRLSSSSSSLYRTNRRPTNLCVACHTDLIVYRETHDSIFLYILHPLLACCTEHIDAQGEREREREIVGAAFLCSIYINIFTRAHTHTHTNTHTHAHAHAPQSAACSHQPFQQLVCVCVCVCVCSSSRV